MQQMNLKGGQPQTRPTPPPPSAAPPAGPARSKRAARAYHQDATALVRHRPKLLGSKRLLRELTTVLRSRRNVLQTMTWTLRSIKCPVHETSYPLRNLLRTGN